jgi:hypothetical protein
MDSQDDEYEEIIPFVPTDTDVVSTKIRTWTKHPGNQFYSDTIQAAADNMTLDNPTDFREAAKEIRHLLCVIRGGRFLKLPEGVSDTQTCMIMSEKDSVNKVIHALKTAKKRKVMRAAGLLPPPFAKAAQYGLQPFKINKNRENHKANKRKLPMASRKIDDDEDEDQVEKSQFMSEAVDLPPEVPPGPPPPKKRRSLISSVNSKSNDNDSTKPNTTPTCSAKSNNTTPSPRKPIVRRLKVAYQAVIHGDNKANHQTPCNSYALTLISKVCSQPGNPSKAHHVLDKPDAKTYQSVDEEPDKDRFLRLQLRQRFASAVAVGITPIEFARKLLKLWGGELRQVKVEAPPKKPSVKRRPSASPADKNKAPKTESSPAQPTLADSTPTSENVNNNSDTTPGMDIAADVAYNTKTFSYEMSSFPQHAFATAAAVAAASDTSGGKDPCAPAASSPSKKPKTMINL